MANPTLKKDPVATAVKKSASATNLFSAAARQLAEANVLLDEAIAADAAEIRAREERISFAKQQAASNQAVANKLQEFIP